MYEKAGINGIEAIAPFTVLYLSVLVLFYSYSCLMDYIFVLHFSEMLFSDLAGSFKPARGGPKRRNDYQCPSSTVVFEL